MDDQERTDQDPPGSRRRAWFGGGVLVGIALGVAATLTAPQLLPRSEPDCVRPERFVWSQEGGTVTTEVTFADDGIDGCRARVVFEETPTAR